MRYDWTLNELKKLYEMPLLDLVHKAGAIHRQHHDSQSVQVCHLINIKSGGCSEDCKYCAQSSRYQTGLKAEKMMDVDTVVAQALVAKSEGASRVCLGSAWRQVRDSKQFDRILSMVTQITDLGLEVCCTLGMLSPSQAAKLKKAGLYAYNHNLDSSKEFYETIITTRTYEDRLDTIGNVRQADISVCSGGIIGMGETVDDRLGLLLTLSSQRPHPESVPINRLFPVKGTPLEGQEMTSWWELVKMVAIARIVMPRAMVRLSAGRMQLSQAEQAICFAAGANSIHAGEKLLTVDNAGWDADRALFDLLGLKPKPPSHNFLAHRLDKRKRDGLLRHLSQPGELIDLTSNDYLGFARSKTLSRTIADEFNHLVEEGGIRPVVGATGSRLLTGNGAYCEALEKKISAYHRAETGLLFNSGYVANMGLLSSVATPDDTILFDAQVHASTWEGAKLSGAKMMIFAHNDMTSLERQLNRAKGRVFVCVESLYSMGGDLAPLDQIATLVGEARGHLIVDEAHATGVVGSEGRGLVCELGLEERVFARVHTFSKALGTHGAIVLGSELLRDYLINFSRPLIYTTAFPLHTLVSISCVYDRLLDSEKDRRKLQSLINYFPYATSTTPIHSLLIGDVERVKELSCHLQAAGLDVRAITYPTVRKGKEMLRVCLHAFNNKKEIDLLVDQLDQLGVARCA